jgi:DNA polymerase-1
MIEFDVETTSLQHHGAETCDLFLAQFYEGDPRGAWLAYVDGRGDFTEVGDDPQRIVQQHLNKPDGYRAWNAKFDLHVLKQAGYRLPDESQWHDGMVMAHIIDERTSVALKARGGKLFAEDAGDEFEEGLKTWLTEETKRRRKASKDDGGEFVEPNYGDVPRGIMDDYAANDVKLQRKICDVYEPQIEANFADLYALERKVLAALFWMEDRGIGMDRDALVRMEADMLPRLDQMEEELVAMTGFDNFNPRSPKQVGEALDRMDADVRFMTRDSSTKQLKVDEENLSACDHPLAQKVLAYRGEHKMFAMLRGILHTGSNDGKFPAAYLTSEDRVHPNFRQVGARTGRMSCANPNFQQVPRDDLRLRYAVAAGAGKKLVTCDLDSIEMRLLAAFAGEGAILNALKDGDDIHQMTADRVGLTGRTRSTGDVEKPRDQGKRMNYLQIYGGGIRAIRKWFGIPQDQARQAIQSYERAYPEVAQLRNRIDWALEDKGYVKSPLTGRRFRMYGSGPRAVEKEGYKFINYLIQGTAADAMKIALAKCHEQGVPVVAAVHDEIIAEVDESDAAEAAQIIEKAFTEFPELADKVPITAEAQIVDRWSDAKKPGYVPAYMED